MHELHNECRASFCCLSQHQNSIRCREGLDCTSALDEYIASNVGVEVSNEPRGPTKRFRIEFERAWQAKHPLDSEVSPFNLYYVSDECMLLGAPLLKRTCVESQVPTGIDLRCAGPDGILQRSRMLHTQGSSFRRRHQHRQPPSGSLSWDPGGRPCCWCAPP